MRCSDAHAHLDPRLDALLDPEMTVMVSCTTREQYAHARSLKLPSLRRASLAGSADQRG